MILFICIWVYDIFIIKLIIKKGDIIFLNLNEIGDILIVWINNII